MKVLVPAILTLAFASAAALPQDPLPPKQPTSVKTFYLKNVTQQNDANEVLTALRNMLRPDVKIILVPSQNSISLNTTPDQMVLAQQIINELDRPRTVYRLTYTILESDAGKRVGVQHFAMIVAAGQRTTLKEGSKVPIVTGGSDPAAQRVYLDVGMNFDATLTESITGGTLRTKVEQSSLAEDKNQPGLAGSPIVRQAVLEGTAVLTLGKPLVLGSLDVPGSTRHLDIEVVAEAVR